MMKVKRVKMKGEVCARSDLEKLLKEVEMVKKRGVSVAGGQDINVEWVSLSSGKSCSHAHTPGQFQLEQLK